MNGTRRRCQGWFLGKLKNHLSSPRGTYFVEKDALRRVNTSNTRHRNDNDRRLKCMSFLWYMR